MESQDNSGNLSFSDRSDSESTHSTPDDERIKRLFFTCDTNGDGFITGEDIRQVCFQLDMEYCVDEIMQQLGTDVNGRISYSDFVKRRSELLNLNSAKSETSEDYESTVSESKDPLIDALSLASSCEMYSNPSSSVIDEQAFGSHQNRSLTLCSEGSNKEILGQNVTYNQTESSGLSNTNSSTRHDSWEFDSGTHDLEFDTISLHKQIEASGIEMPSNINELLDLANKYYIDSINSVKQEKIQIHNQLKTILKEREFLQKQILSLKEEKIYITKELEKKKLRERHKYEDRITELQSMIGELSQNLNYYQFLTIKEEDEQNSDEFSTHQLNDASHSPKDSRLSRKIKGIHSNSMTINNSNKNLGLNEKKEKQNENDFDKCNSQTISHESHLNARELDSHATALEIDRLKCRITNLESQIDLSSIHLNESKENAERLTVLLGKYDANNSALQLALSYSDKALEVNELLVTLLESEIGLVLANCRAAGLGKLTKMSEKEEHEEVIMIYERATDNRKHAEDSALNYLIKNCSHFDYTVGKKSEFSRDDEIYLRNILHKFKHENSFVRTSIVELESFIVELDKNKKAINTQKGNSVLNIEDIVLMQDFMAIKELNASLRSQLYSLRKENSDLTQQVIKLEAISGDRSKTDKLRTEETITKKMEEIKISEKLVNNLKKQNSNLLEQLEKVKKKCSLKVKKLEHRISTNQQRYRAHVKMLQNRISIVENDQSLKKCIETTI